MVNAYSNSFLRALAKWQCGWHEDKDRRIEITNDLMRVIDDNRSALPAAAFDAPEICFRKRFLVPNNPQNGGDFLPFIWDGEIAEGVASWTTDYNFAKNIFKKEIRPNEVAIIFFHKPKPEDVVINITNLWNDNDFVESISSYIKKQDDAHSVFSKIGNKQSEVVLRSSLSIDRVRAFCGKVPLIEDICARADIRGDNKVDEIWSALVARDIFPFDAYWIEREAADAALDRFLAVITARWEERGWIKRRI